VNGGFRAGRLGIGMSGLGPVVAGGRQIAGIDPLQPVVGVCYRGLATGTVALASHFVK
jgi:hypothetical protein